MKNKIILIGYRATGKTSLSKAIAERLGWDWLDTDPLIEQRAGKTIAKIFAEDGEPHFRDLEEQTVAEVLQRTQPLVIATGGGVPMREISRKRLKESGVVFWLQARPETIHRRMNSDSSTADRRPALTDLSPIREIESVLAKRLNAYQDCSHFEINTDSKSLREITDSICEQFQKVA